jgi:hypothetical protein
MKLNTIKTTLIALVAIALAAPSLKALTVVGQIQTVNGYGPYQAGNGGEFTLKVNSGTALFNALPYYSSVASNQWTASGTTPNFQTFCVEGSEYIYSNTAAYVSIGQQTHVSTNTTLTQGAAWLYAMFASGQLNSSLFSSFGLTGPAYANSYDYSNTAPGTRYNSALNLQYTIWALMGQEGKTLGNTSTDIYTQLVLAKFGSAANALLANASSGNYNVAVLSLWGGAMTIGGDVNTSNPMQDQLILTGAAPAPASVPDGGATLMLLGGSVGLLGFLKRKLA